MLCKIADLIVDVPEAGGLAPRCREYLYSGTERPDIVIDPKRYNRSRYSPLATEEQLAYMESGRQFNAKLIMFDGFYLHSSAVGVDGRAYLFSGKSGVGKSTHVGLWQKLLGEKVCRFNDDKPALRLRNGTWYAYGTPWCGKDGINENKHFPIAGICFLQQGDKNEIRRLTHQEAVTRLLSQTIYRFRNPERLNQMLGHLERLVEQIPIYELVNRPEIEAAKLSYETMRSENQAGEDVDAFLNVMRNAGCIEE